MPQLISLAGFTSKVELKRVEGLLNAAEPHGVWILNAFSFIRIQGAFRAAFPTGRVSDAEDVSSAVALGVSVLLSISAGVTFYHLGILLCLFLRRRSRRCVQAPLGVDESVLMSHSLAAPGNCLPGKAMAGARVFAKGRLG